MKLWKQDKGQLSCVKAFLNAINSGNASPIPAEQILEISRVSIKLAQ